MLSVFTSWIYSVFSLLGESPAVSITESEESSRVPSSCLRSVMARKSLPASN
jgi:hypothetical protein